MATTKERKNLLMVWASEVIAASSICKDGVIVSDSYNGQIAAFSVSVALSGLKPAMALYYSDKGSSEVDKKEIIKLLASMYGKETNAVVRADDFFRTVIRAQGADLDAMKKRVIEYGIAMKLAVRTFKFKSNE